MENYAYAAPSSVAETVALLADNASAGRQTQILAGGTDVLVQMRSAGHTPRTIVDIKTLAETNRLEVGAGGAAMGGGGAVRARRAGAGSDSLRKPASCA